MGSGGSLGKNFSQTCLWQAYPTWPLSRLCLWASSSDFCSQPLPEICARLCPWLRGDTDHFRGQTGSFSRGWLGSGSEAPSHPAPGRLQAPARGAQVWVPPPWLRGARPRRLGVSLSSFCGSSHLPPVPHGGPGQGAPSALFLRPKLGNSHREAPTSLPPAVPRTSWGHLGRQVALEVLFPGEHFRPPEGPGAPGVAGVSAAPKS